METGLIAAFLLLADFSDRLHVLLLIATVAVYTIVALVLFAVGAHMSRNTQLVLRGHRARRRAENGLNWVDEIAARVRPR